MAYYLSGFSTVTFPLVQPITEMPTVPAMQGAIATLGGGFDAWGSDDAPAAFPVFVQYRVAVASAVAATYVAAVDELRGLARKRAYLARKAQDGTVHYALARLTSVTGTDTIETFSVLELTLEFEVWEHWWGQLYEETATLTGSPQDVPVTGYGNIADDYATLTITAGDAAITAVTVACGDATWTYTGTIVIGNSLIVDAGAWSVLNDGADAYADFAFGALHVLPGMFRLLPGANTVTVTYTGGGTGSTIKIDYSDAWA